jgi:hypothetical protein
MGDQKTPRVWLKAFWGFDPANEGYLGFTKPGDRARFIEEARDGDLVLIYGADAVETASADRRQALGFLEPELVPISDRERMSSIGLQLKISNGWISRWTNAVPVRRAWRVNRRIEIKHLAPITYRQDRARVIASRGDLLTEEEARRALELPVSAVNVFGEEAIPAEAAGEFQLRTVFRPSRGIEPTFGRRTHDVEDGKHFLYMLRLEGNASALINRSSDRLFNKIVVKIGYSKDPKHRCDDHNAALPPASLLKWKLTLTSKAFSDGSSAKAAEDVLKAELDRSFESLGGEFFLGDEKGLSSSFYAAAAPAAFVIKATPKIQRR